jgi:hypothetical protein
MKDKQNLTFQYIIAALMTLGLHLLITSNVYEENDRLKYTMNDDAKDERDNLPISIHNDRLFVIQKTVFQFDDFKRFVTGEPAFGATFGAKLLDAQTIDKGVLRHMLSLYIGDRLRYTSQSTYELEDKRDYNRHYFGHKGAKDLLMLFPGDSLKIEEVKNLFESRALLNYCNDLILNIIDYYVEMRNEKALGYNPMTQKVENFDFEEMKETIN